MFKEVMPERKRTCPNCNHEFSWHNNDFNKRVWTEIRKTDGGFPFSLEDIDGVVVFLNSGKPRLIIYEHKFDKELGPGGRQMALLYTLEENIKWENFDHRSGVFLIRGSGNYDKTSIRQLKNRKWGAEKTVDFSYYWDWFCDKRISKCSKCRETIELKPGEAIKLLCKKHDWKQ